MHSSQAFSSSNDVVRRFSPLVMRVARHLVSKLPPSVALDDVVQAGMIGLMDAARRFNDEQGAQFETFATQRIRGAMLDALREGDWVPRSVRKSQRCLDSAISTLEHKLGRAPREAEIADELGLPLGEYREMLVEARGTQIFNYDDLVGEDRDESFLDRYCPDAAADPLVQLEDKRFKAALVEAIQDLPEREQILMGLYYEQDLNFREIAAVMGVTESRVCQLHSQAVARLRAKLRD